MDIKCCANPDWQEVMSRDDGDPYDVLVGTVGEYPEDAVEVTTDMHVVWRCESCRSVFVTREQP